MAIFTCIEEIQAWQKARKLVSEIYRMSKNGEFAKDFSFKDQIKRAGYSIMNNISEGFERDGNKEYGQFLAIAKGSTGEVKSMAYVALDQNYINKADFDLIINYCKEIGAMIYGLMRYLKNSKIKGTKYR